VAAPAASSIRAAAVDGAADLGVQRRLVDRRTKSSMPQAE
jgi:hypothetical protein